jgi:hypothetical protein
VLVSVLILTLCVSLGDIVNRSLAEYGMRLPGFLTSMFVGIVIVNTADVLKRPLNMTIVDKFSELALNIFLAMSMMAIQLWTLAAAAHVITVVLVLQVLLMTLFAIYVVFRVMGSDYGRDCFRFCRHGSRRDTGGDCQHECGDHALRTVYQGVPGSPVGRRLFHRYSERGHDQLLHSSDQGLVALTRLLKDRYQP